MCWRKSLARSPIAGVRLRSHIAVRGSGWLVNAYCSTLSRYGRRKFMAIRSNTRIFRISRLMNSGGIKISLQKSEATATASAAVKLCGAEPSPRILGDGKPSPAQSNHPCRAKCNTRVPGFLRTIRKFLENKSRRVYCQVRYREWWPTFGERLAQTAP